MPNTYTLLETITVGAAGASSVTFNSIPSTGYTDLKIVMSVRSANASNFDNPRISINGSTSTFTRKEIYGESGSVGAEQPSDRIIGNCPAANTTSNTFGSLEFYLPNYTSSNYKTWSCDSVTENNSATNSMWLLAGLWSTTTAVSTIAVSLQTGGNFAQHSTFSLYGVSALGVTPTRAPKATGGSIIQTDGTYWYHAFLATGEFKPATALTCDVLVVGGGGGGQVGGGGAGGLLYTAAQSYSTAQTITVGGGGSSANGNNSSCGALVATGGGTGSTNFATAGQAGGSGGGGGDAGGGLGTSGQGNKGGNGSGASNNTGGGGGAGTAGSNAPSGGNGGAGGNGLNTYSTWASTTGTGDNGYYAGGGGGRGSVSNGANGLGGGSTANVGGGGLGTTQAGGSGIVIVRYLA
jgi:hypothetical protein